MFVFLLSVFAMLPSCTRETWSPEETGGGSILFGASTSYSDSPGTRTEYSGLDGSGASVSSGSSVEQINWLSSDKIRILSAQATSAYGAGVQYADYLVTPKDDAQKGGIAPLTSSGSASNAEGLQWGTTFPHVFYAVYPSPQQSDAVSVSLSGDNAVVSASIPATQTGSWDGDTYKPDMDYAYMWSVASASVKGEVPLPFRPLVTVFEVSLLAEDAAMAAKTLTGVRLSSSAGGAALSGSFSATLTPTTAAATPPEVSVTDSPAPGTSVGITFPASAGVQLSQTSAKQFTLFALPVDQSQLTLTLTFSDGTNRLLDFKSASLAAGDNPEGWITLPAGKKAFAYNLGVDSPPAASPASIPFSASRGQVATRTEYAGYDPESGAGVENINWLASDQVRILSAQASSAYGAGVHHADYAVTPGAAEATSATIAPLKSDGTAGGNGLQWGTAFPHVFYALYPSSRQNNTVSFDLSGDGAVLSAEIPAGQDGTMDGSVCKPDMSYAYMYAVKEVNAQETVSLDFQPLVTTLEVTLKASESVADAVLSSKLLTSVSLSSTAGPLSGRFPVTMTSSSVVMPTASDITSGTNSVSLSGFSVALSKTEAKSFTLLMLPLTQTGLTLTLGFSDGTSKSLQLKDSGTPISITACRKTYIRNISVPFN